MVCCHNSPFGILVSNLCMCIHGSLVVQKELFSPDASSLGMCMHHSLIVQKELFSPNGGSAHRLLVVKTDLFGLKRQYSLHVCALSPGCRTMTQHCCCRMSWKASSPFVMACQVSPQLKTLELQAVIMDFTFHSCLPRHCYSGAQNVSAIEPEDSWCCHVACAPSTTRILV